MNYKIFTEELSRITKINKNIFEFNLKNEILIEEDSVFRKYKCHNEKNYFIEYFEYKENIKENWEAITLYINLNRQQEFIEIINSILSKYSNEKIINSKTINNFKFNKLGLIYLQGFINDDFLQVDIAKFKN